MLLVKVVRRLWGVSGRTYKIVYTAWSIFEEGFREEESLAWQDISVSRAMPARGGRAMVRAGRNVGIGRE